MSGQKFGQFTYFSLSRQKYHAHLFVEFEQAADLAAPLLHHGLQASDLLLQLTAVHAAVRAAHVGLQPLADALEAGELLGQLLQQLLQAALGLAQRGRVAEHLLHLDGGGRAGVLVVSTGLTQSAERTALHQLERRQLVGYLCDDLVYNE